MIFVTEIDHPFGFKGNDIIGDDFLGEAKSGEDITLKELDDHNIIGLSTRNGFDPLSEVISSY